MPIVPLAGIEGDVFNPDSPFRSPDARVERFVDTETGAIMRRTSTGGFKDDGMLSPEELERLRSSGGGDDPASDLEDLFNQLLGGDSRQNELFDLQLEILKDQIEGTKRRRAAIEARIGRPFEEWEAENIALLGEAGKLQAERLIKALKGELPVSPALERDLAQRESLAKETVARNLGPTGETSSAGIQLLGRTREGADIAREAARHGEITEGSMLAKQLTGTTTALGSPSISNRQLLGDVGGVLTGARNDAEFRANLGLKAFDISEARRRGEMQAMASLYGGGGPGGPSFLQQYGPAIGSSLTTAAALAAMWYFAPVAAVSTAKAKRAIRPLDPDEYEAALKRVRATPIVRYRYKWEKDAGPPHIGPILELAPPEISDDGVRVNVLDYLGLQHAALKAVDRKVTRIAAVVTGGK